MSVWCFQPGLTSIHRKCLSYDSIQQKSLSHNSIHQVYGENAYYKIFIHFQKNNWKKSLKDVCGFLSTVEQTADGKNWLQFFFEKHAYHTIYIYENCMTRIFAIRNKFFENLRFLEVSNELVAVSQIMRANCHWIWKTTWKKYIFLCPCVITLFWIFSSSKIVHPIESLN